MTRRNWLYNIMIVVAVWFVDFVTKQLAMEYVRSVKFYGPFGFVLHYNPGAMLGAFATLPPVLRIVSLSTGGAFLCFIYLALQHLIPQTATKLRIGMSLLLGGILGNVSDRIWRGSVTDFLLIGSTAHSTPAFNLADSIQWLGYILVVYSLIREGHLFWPENNIRRKIWINPRFQIKYIGLLMVIGLGFVVVSGVFFYTYLKITIESLPIPNAMDVEHQYLAPFFITFTFIALGFLLTLLIIGRIVSHRTAGPLYAFEKFLEDVLAGKDRGMKLRAGDEFRHLEELSEKLRLQLKKT